MDINKNKYSLFTSSLDDTHNTRMERIFPFQNLDINEGVIYLGFTLKPNNYGKAIWGWILTRIKNHISFWCNRWWLFRGDRLVLVKYVLDAILVFYHTLSHISKGVMEMIKKGCFKFLWKGSSEYC
jgi:hypothetical protein